jgi:hypothetical protein
MLRPVVRFHLAPRGGREEGGHMPTRPSKGDHGRPDAGSKGRGNQKAVTGSAVSPEVAEAQKEAVMSEEGTEPDDRPA